MDLLKAPPGYQLDRAVLTTYSLDLEALLALPLAVLAQAEGGLEELLADPLLLLESLREAGTRVHLFVDQAGIAIPRTERAIYAMLEQSVHPVSAPNQGAFHPKVWVARFTHATQKPLLRVAVLSRNLTFDRSWDIALTSEATPTGRRRAKSRALGDLLRSLPGISNEPLPDSLLSDLETLAGEVERTQFPAPEGFTEPISYQALGLPGSAQRTWKPRKDGARLLAIAPFTNRTGLDALTGITSGHSTLVSRQESLDALSEEALADWDDIFVLSDTAADEATDETADRPSGLHAKAIAIEHGWDVSWFVGSANFTAAAFQGKNVEVMASVTGRKGSRDSRKGSGIDRFLDNGFLALCEPYRPQETEAQNDDVITAQRLLEETRDAVIQNDKLKIQCRQADNGWRWSLHGNITLPDGIEMAAWPVSISEEHARTPPNLEWPLPTARLTRFVAFRLRATCVKIDDLRFTLKCPAEGLPDDRLGQILRTLIDSPERFLRFLRALLGGLDGLVDWSMDERKTTESTQWVVGIGGETLLEDLVRIASRDPGRLEPVRKLITDLRSTEEGRQIVPDDLYAVWRVVEEAIQDEGHVKAP
jgi:hypothetical protein